MRTGCRHQRALPARRPRRATAAACWPGCRTTTRARTASGAPRSPPAPLGTPRAARHLHHRLGRRGRRRHRRRRQPRYGRLAAAQRHRPRPTSTTTSGRPARAAPAPRWNGPMRVLNADWVSSPAVVIDRNGQRATVAFTQPLIGYRWNVLHTRWTPPAGWSAAQPLETTNQAGGDARRSHPPPGHRRRRQRPRRLAAQGRRRRPAPLPT